MIKKILIVLLFALPGTFGLYAETEDVSTIERMGQLNGVALGCRYFDETRRIKTALIESLPKLRKFGKVFEDTTNASYLAFTESKPTCPAVGEFTADVDAAIEELYKDFPPSL